jgi:hypothetical protein
VIRPFRTRVTLRFPVSGLSEGTLRHLVVTYMGNKRVKQNAVRAADIRLVVPGLSLRLIFFRSSYGSGVRSASGRREVQRMSAKKGKRKGRVRSRRGSCARRNGSRLTWATAIAFISCAAEVVSALPVLLHLL